MLEIFGMHKGGTEYRRLVTAFERIFGTTIFFGTDQLRGTAKMVQQSRFNFLREAQLWYNKRPDYPMLSDHFENVIVLSNEFYQEIKPHPIPTDLEAIRTLAASPAVLDLFMWLSYRCFAAKSQNPFRFSVHSASRPIKQCRRCSSAEISREARGLARCNQGDVTGVSCTH